MADKKISALTAATTPLAGTEVLPIVQSGTTVRVSVDNLTTGKVTPTNGVKFPATQVASSDPNTLDDYEEGSWTPGWGVASGSVTANSNSSGRYRKVGDTVTVWGYISYQSSSGASGNLWVTGLPFTSSDGFGQGSAQSGGGVVYLTNLWTSNHPQTVQIPNSSTILNLYRPTYIGSPVSSSQVQASDLWADVNYSQAIFVAQYRV